MAKAFDYQAKSKELEDILQKLQDTGLPVDEALALFDRGEKLIVELESYLKMAENTIKKHTAGADLSE